MSHPALVVVTTSYPRHAQDTAGPFVQASVQALRSCGARVQVLAPDHVDADAEQTDITWLRYALRRRAQTLCYGSGVLSNLRAEPRAALQLPGLLAALTLALARRRHQTVFAHWLLPAALCAISAGCRRVVGVAHGSDVALLERLPSGVALARALARRCRGLAFVSHELRERFARLIGHRAGVILPPVVRVLPCPTRSQARQQLRLADNTSVVLFVGRLVPGKGLDHLLCALPAQACLLIAGDGPERTALQHLAAQHTGEVRFVGAVGAPTLGLLISAADVLAIPSLVDPTGHAEGLPAVLLEAMAHSLPVVASRVGGIPEVLQHDVQGRLVQSGDIVELRQALSQVFDDRLARERYARAARATAVDWGPQLHARCLLRLAGLTINSTASVTS